MVTSKPSIHHRCRPSTTDPPSSSYTACPCPSNSLLSFPSSSATSLASTSFTNLPRPFSFSFLSPSTVSTISAFWRFRCRFRQYPKRNIRNSAARTITPPTTPPTMPPIWEPVRPFEELFESEESSVSVPLFKFANVMQQRMLESPGQGGSNYIPIKILAHLDFRL